MLRRSLIASVALWVTVAGAGPAAEAAERALIEVRGSDYEWTTRYPGEDGELGTPDDPEVVGDRIRLPADTPVRLELRSEDYIYLFEIPDWSLQEAAVPDIELHLDLGRRPVGEVSFLGGQMCGYAHPDLDGKLVFESPTELREWLRTRPRRSEEPPSGDR